MGLRPSSTNGHWTLSLWESPRSWHSSREPVHLQLESCKGVQTKERGVRRECNDKPWALRINREVNAKARTNAERARNGPKVPRKLEHKYSGRKVKASLILKVFLGDGTIR